MKVLLSIKPEHANNILDGKKHFEYRKAIFRSKQVSTALIYATLPVGKIIGEFKIDSVFFDIPQNVWKLTEHKSGISELYFNKYFEGRSKAYAIKIKNPVRYPQPKELHEVLKSGIAPQSFCYI